MTIYEVLVGIETRLDNIDSGTNPFISYTQYDEFINAGVESLIKTRYGINNIYKQGFEAIQKRTDELGNYVKYVQLDPTTTPAPYTVKDIAGVGFQKPNDHYYTLVERIIGKKDVEICEVTCGKKEKSIKTFPLEIPVRAARHNDINELFTDPFHKPTEKNAIRITGKNTYFIYTKNTVTIEKLILTYIRKPIKLKFEKVPTPNPNYLVYTTDPTSPNFYKNVEFTILNESLHQEIIDLVVDRILEATNNPRVQTHPTTLSKVE